MASPYSPRRVVGGVREWQVWALQPVVRGYVVAVVCLDLGLTVAALAAAPVRVSLPRLALYLGLLGCAAVTVEATKNIKDVKGTDSHDLLGVWFVTIALLFPPGLALLAPLLTNAFRQARAPRMFLYRRVFSAATVSLGAGAASGVFHAAPAAIAGPAPLSGTHAATWLFLAVGCALLCWLINHTLVLAVIRLATPDVPLRDAFGGRTALITDLIELNIAVTFAFAAAAAPVVIFLVLPLVVFGQRYLMNAQLVSQTRVDAQSGALTAAIWRYEADVEAHLAQRTHTPLAVVLAEIDETSVGKIAGSVASTVLRAVVAEVAAQLPPTAQIGRLHGGTFAAVLPDVDEDEARWRAVRIRDHIAAEPVAIESGDQLDFILRPTVSVGVAGQTDSRQMMTELIAAAAVALAGARAGGGNQVRVSV